MAEKVYLVSPGAQRSEIDLYCFKECGKILIGVIKYLDAPFFPCKTDKCPWTEESMEIGECSNGDGKLFDMRLRKLKCASCEDLQLSLELERERELR